MECGCARNDWCSTLSFLVDTSRALCNNNPGIVYYEQVWGRLGTGFEGDWLIAVVLAPAFKTDCLKIFVLLQPSFTFDCSRYATLDLKLRALARDFFTPLPVRMLLLRELCLALRGSVGFAGFGRLEPHDATDALSSTTGVINCRVT